MGNVPKLAINVNRLSIYHKILQVLTILVHFGMICDRQF